MRKFAIRVKNVFHAPTNDIGPNSRPQRRIGLRRSILWVMGLIAGVVGLLVIYLIVTSFHKQVEEAEKLTQTLVRVVEDQTSRSLQSIILVLDATEREFRGRSAIDRASTSARLRSVPEIRGLYIIGPDGKVIDSTMSAADIGVDESARDFVRRLRETQENVVVGKPILRRSPGGAELPALAYLPVAHRAADGKNILVAVVNISFLELQYRSLLGSTDAAICISTFAGEVIVDSSGIWSTSTRVAAQDPIFTSYLPGREVATFDRASMLGRPAELVSFRVTRAFPVVVSVAISYKSIRSEWLVSSLPSLLATLAAVLLVLIALWHLMRQFQVIQRQEETLVRARDAAEAASRAKSQFLAVMSHEIRTPMNAVLGMASSLLDQKLSPEQRTSVEAIHDAGDSLLVILNDILDYARLETGQLALESIPFDPRSVAERAVAIMGPRAAEKQLALDVSEAKGLPAAVRGDAVRLTQVLLNVLGNAVKFTEQGAITVAVTATEEENGRARISWRVTDTGIGIAPDQIGTLFRDFVQADPSIHRRFGGSGLGLAICKKIIEQMGGEIYATSEVGRGTTVIFSVSFDTTEVPKAAESTSADNSEQGVRDQIKALGRHLRTLVVDDNATNRIVAQKMLTSLGAEVDFAEDGTIAVEKAMAEPYDLILMDMRMPNLDGPSATRAIRSGGGPNADAFIVAFTANAFPEDVAVCRDAGMDDVVPKPVRKRNLVAVLETALAKASPGAVKISSASLAAVAPTADLIAFEPRVYSDLEREIGSDTMAEAFHLFASEAKIRLQEMRQLAPANPEQLEKIGRLAHTLKGDAGSFGFMKAQALAFRLEKAAKAGPIDGYDDQLEALARAFEEGLSYVPAVAAA